MGWLLLAAVMLHLMLRAPGSGGIVLGLSLVASSWRPRGVLATSPQRPRSVLAASSRRPRGVPHAMAVVLKSSSDRPRIVLGSCSSSSNRPQIVQLSSNHHQIVLKSSSVVLKSSSIVLKSFSSSITSSSDRPRSVQTRHLISCGMFSHQPCMPFPSHVVLWTCVGRRISATNHQFLWCTVCVGWTHS